MNGLYLTYQSSSLMNR